MAFDLDLYEAVKNHADIVEVISSYIKVIRKGKGYVAICPFHDDSNPSMQISKEKQIFKCFVCQTGGDCIRFVELYEHIDKFSALRKVAAICGYSDPRLEKKSYEKPIDDKNAPYIKCLRDLTAYYEYALKTDEGKEGYDYFISRHLDEKMQAKYHLGYSFIEGKKTISYLESKGNSLKTMEMCGFASNRGSEYFDKNAGRVIFPILDINGETIGYSARRLKDDDTAKYINSPETVLFHKSSVLYNINIAKEAARHAGYVYILEGFMDVFALSRIGIDSAVALMGTAFTDEHLKILRSLNVELRICLDGDKPGQDAMLKINEKLKNSGLLYRFVDNHNSPKDSDEILNEDGEDKLKAYLNNLLSPFDFALNYFTNTSPVTSMEERKKLVAYFLPYMLTVRSTLEFNDYLKRLSSVSKFDMDSIKDMIQKARGKKDEEIKDVIYSFHPERKSLKRFELAEREILYQMVNHPEVVEFYEKKVESFYDEIYRKIADYIVDYYQTHPEYKPSDLVLLIETSEDDKSEEMVSEITSLAMENGHPEVSEEYLDSILETIKEEKNKMYETSLLERTLEGKTEIEKARIIADFNRHKMNKGEK